jgi:hypothetical protein
MLSARQAQKKSSSARTYPLIYSTIWLDFYVSFLSPPIRVLFLPFLMELVDLLSLFVYIIAANSRAHLIQGWTYPE